MGACGSERGGSSDGGTVGGSAATMSGHRSLDFLLLLSRPLPM